MPAPFENEAQLFSFSAIPQMVFDPHSNQIVAVNEEASRLLRMAIPMIKRRKVSTLFADSFPWLLVFTEQVLSHGRGWTDQLRVTIHNQPCRVEASGRSAELGERTLMFLSLQSVSTVDNQRQQSEAHQHYRSGIGNWNRVTRIFQEFERENRLLLDAAGEGIYGVDTNGITTFVNPAAEAILGYTVAELENKNMHALVHHSHGDGSNFAASECPIFLAFKEGMVQVVDNDVFWHKSGKAIDVEYTSTPICDDGLIVGAVVVFRDVSQKRAKDEQLRLALAEVERLKNRLELENSYLQDEINSEFNHHQIIGRSAPLQQVLRQIELVAPTDATVLVNGETGTGKELIARAIHDSSHRSERPLIRVNCAAIPHDLFESEFFGHVKGAFTGANTNRLGRFELADGGTLFLDEVGEIPLHLQGKLLRVLQEQSYERVGDATTRRVDVRIIAATNRDLSDSVAKGQFREDLYFRLNVFPIVSLALRDRADDIPLLTQHFLQKISARTNKQNLKIPLSELAKLTAYHWPGNVRELENVIERQVILAKDQTLRFGNLLNTADAPVTHTTVSEQPGILSDDEIQQRIRGNIIRALQQSGGKVSGATGAAALLAVKPTTLTSRMKKFNIRAKHYAGDRSTPP